MKEEKNKRVTIHQLKKKKHLADELQELYLKCLELEDEILIIQAVIDFKPNGLNLHLLKNKVEQSKKESSEELNFYVKNPRQFSIDWKIIETYHNTSEKIKLNLDRLNFELKSNKKNLDSKLNLASEILRNIHLGQFPITKKAEKRKVNNRPIEQTTAKVNVIVEAPVRISPKESWRLLVSNTKIPDGQYSVDWNKIKFGDGVITADIRGYKLSLNSISSRKYLNNIKDKYIFSETPQILILIENGQGRLVNEQVLNYHIGYFEVAILTYRNDNVKSFELFKFRGQNVRFFASRFPYYFKDKCFQFLCSRCSHDDKIFPLHERVIHSNQTEKICESFLFPFKGRFSNYVIWESIYESRATYIFQFDIKDLKAMNKLFVFLTGETINKRETLRSSPRLQENLHFQRMIPHSDFQQWKSEISRM